MESLYRKYRPQTFSDVVGQQHVVATLERAVVEGRINHAYLFCGPRGTGKTTMARLLAKALMCEHGPGQLPDGTCEQCLLIARGEHPDVYELDAASRTGVDNVREEIINRVGYAPVRGRYKVYIIDEVHMLTVAAFNALLKTLEEPPEHVIFVLCTTDPQKIPATILSRVQRFDFRPIGNEDILARLNYVCEREGFAYEEEALELVVRNARGGMRDALSTLEQLSVFGGGTIGLAATRDLLGAVSGAALEQVVDALARRDVPALFDAVSNLVDSGRDLLQFTRELAAHFRDVYVASIVGGGSSYLSAGSDGALLVREAEAFGSTDRLARILTQLGEVSREMATAPNQRLVLEIAFTRMARPKEDLTLEALAERLADVERRLQEQERGLPVSVTEPAQTPPTQEERQGRAAPAASPREVPSPQFASRPTQTTTRPSQPQAASQAAQQVPPRNNPQMSSQASPTWAAPRPQHQPQRQSQAVAGQRPQQQVLGPSTNAQARPAAAQQVMRPSEAASRERVQTVQLREGIPSQVRPQQGMRTPREERVRQAVPQESAPTVQVPAATARLDTPALQRAWRQVISEMVSRMASRGSLITSSMALSDDGNEVLVGLPRGSSFALKMLERPDVHAAVEGVVARVMGPRTVRFKEGLETGEASVQQSAPAPRRPAPMPSRTQTAPVASTREGTAAYALPWEEPASSGDSYEGAPPYEPVPYDELGTGYMEDEANYADVPPSPVDTQARPQSREGASRQAPAATTPSPQPQEVPQAPQKPPSFAGGGRGEESKVSPVSGPSSTSEKASHADEPSGGANEVMTELSPELVAILENAFEVFGPDLKVIREGS